MNHFWSRVRIAFRIPRTWRYHVTFRVAGGRIGTTIVELGWRITDGEGLTFVEAEVLPMALREPCLVTGYRLMALRPFRRPAPDTEAKHLRFVQP